MHKDILGNYLNVGDPVCYAKSNSLYRGTITALTPKMVKVSPPNSNWERLVYPSDCIVPGRLPV